MSPLTIYCKSYSKDVQRCKILFDSILKYNKDNIPFYISVPKEDIQLFINTLGVGGYILLPDEEIIKDIQLTIKKIEDKKLIIKNKISTFNDQIKLTDTPQEASTLNKNITDLQKQLADLDKMLKEKQKDIQKFNK